MSTFTTTQTVGEIVTRQPSLARVFEGLDIDYCCGGKVSLEEACRGRNLDPAKVAVLLAEEAQRGERAGSAPDPAAMSLTELTNHIIATHHDYLRNELPRLYAMTKKVAAVHGEKDTRLLEIHTTFCALAEEMGSHMMKEERILFPMIRQMEAGEANAAAHCGSVSAPIRQMELEHDQAGSALADLNRLSDAYTPPDWACNTYRAMLDSLRTLESDMHQHVHKENNVLFPRAIRLEAGE